MLSNTNLHVWVLWMGLDQFLRAVDLKNLHLEWPFQIRQMNSSGDQSLRGQWFTQSDSTFRHTFRLSSKEKRKKIHFFFQLSFLLLSHFLETDEKYFCNLSLMTIKVQSHYPLLLNCLLFYRLIEGMTHYCRNLCAHPQPALPPPALGLLSWL